MATISGYDSSSLSVLFSSLNKNAGSSNVSLLGGGSDLLGINYSDYATIRNGSYLKLMKSYYSLDASDGVKDAVSKKTTSTSKDDTETLAKIEDAAETMKTSADALLEKGQKSVFSTGDTEKIYNAVDKFVTNYNSLLKKASDSETSNISGAAERMVRMTKSNEKMLNSIGITIGEDNQLKLDKEAFEKADVSVVKGMFQSTGGFGYQVSAQASMINYYAENEASKSNTYSNAGTYTYNYNSGALYNEGI